MVSVLHWHFSPSFTWFFSPRVTKGPRSSRGRVGLPTNISSASVRWLRRVWNDRGCEVLRGLCLWPCTEFQVGNTCSRHVVALQGKLEIERMIGAWDQVALLRALGGSRLRRGASLQRGWELQSLPFLWERRLGLHTIIHILKTCSRRTWREKFLDLQKQILCTAASWKP